jgi:hypothetical protein
MSSYVPVLPAGATSTYADMPVGEQKKERARLRALMTPIEKNTDELAYQASLKAQRVENERKARAASIAEQKSTLKTAAAAAAKASAPKTKEQKKAEAMEAAAKKRGQKN